MNEINPPTPSPSQAGISPAAAHYQVPGWFTQHVFNQLVRLLTRMGVSVMGSRELRVRGRQSGEWRTNPVNLLTLDGRSYLVAPRGETQWVRNLRAAGNGELRVGRRIEPFTATELGDDDKPEVLRAYLRRWKVEVGVFFEGVDADADDEVLRGIAARHPVFVIEARALAEHYEVSAPPAGGPQYSSRSNRL